MGERQPGDPLGPNCGHKVHEDCLICFECGTCSESLGDDDVCEECRTVDEPPSQCTGECRDMAGKNWVYTGTAYGGDDPSHFGEGRCYCQFCGADGDG